MLDAVGLNSQTRSFRMLATADSYLAAYSLLSTSYRTNSLALSWFSCVEIPATTSLANLHPAKVSLVVV